MKIGYRYTVTECGETWYTRIFSTREAAEQSRLYKLPCAKYGEVEEVQIKDEK